MLFNSVEYFLFLPIVVFLNYIAPPKFRWPMLLAASYIFYMFWRPDYIILIIFITVINFYLGRKIFCSDSISKRKIYLSLSLISCLSILFIFKYENFIGSSLQSLFHSLGFRLYIPFFNMVLPVGLSFYIFQTLSYTIDVYDKKYDAENHFGIFSLYVSFFPQLVAGPIERSTRLLPQFHKNHTFDYQTARLGFQLILLGLLKKVVVADRLAIYVDKVYGSPHFYDGKTLLIATTFFSMQIYCDFSGYTDIAIGSAKILGFDLMQNFKRPYFAKSLSEFWRRWHISLSSWFRDYLYISLGGNKVRLYKWCMNILIVFALSGLWHGAAWTFVIWGVIHGTAFMIERVIVKNIFIYNLLNYNIKFNSIIRIFSMIYTILFVNFAWIFFRANTFSDASLIVNKMFTDPGQLYIGTPTTFIFSLFGIILIILYDINQEWFKGKIKLFQNNNSYIRHFAYAAVVVLILLIGVLDEGQFIYFQF